MIGREFLKSQMRRFSGIPSPPPQTSEAIADIADALESASRSEHHCKRIVTAIVESPGDPPRWPTVATIRAIAWELLTDAEKKSTCRGCDGSGYIHRVRLVNGVPYDASKPCSACRPVEVADE